MTTYIRPISLDDLETLYGFSQEVGYGFTTLPPDKKLLEEKIHDSLRSFHEKIHKPKHETYLFALISCDKMIGVSGLVSRIGMTEPFYAYRIDSEQKTSKLLDVKRDISLLHFMQARKKPTEVCTLYLKKEFRRKDFGRLLSLCRFLFIASFRNRFASHVIGELRGVSDEKGISPFWEAIGGHFFKLSFNEATFLRATHPECIEELFPTHPIYPELLPKSAQEVIGKTHPETLPALKLLERQGFKISKFVDLFDAGPHVSAHTDDIEAIKNSREAVVNKIAPTLASENLALITNSRLSYRACIGPISLEKDKVSLTTQDAKALQIEEGDKIRFLLFI